MKEAKINYPNTNNKLNAKAHFERYLTLSFFAFAGGVLSILIGLIFTIVHAILVKDTFFDEISTILMIAAFPLLIFGGHFIDKAQEKKQ